MAGRAPRALESLDRKGTGAIRDLGEPARADERERALSRHELRAVDEGQPLFGPQTHRLQTDTLERRCAVEQLAVDPGLPLSDER